MKKEIRDNIQKEAQRLKSANQVYDSKHWLAINGYTNTVDVVLLSVKDGELAVLMGKREEKDNNPFGGHYALPGGYVENDDEDALASAKRELKEEFSLEDVYLEQLYTFTTRYRDPRELISNTPIRVWSVAYFALVDYTKLNPEGDSDIVKGSVKWIKMSELSQYPIAFDHQEIIQMGVDRVRGKLNYSNVGFELAPEKFTIPQLQSVFEQVLGEKLDRNNFRTKIVKLGILDKLEEVKKEGRGQPAPYYKLNRDKLLSLKGRSIF